MPIDEQLIIAYYQYFYSKKYGNEKYKFVPSDKAEKTIQDFLQLLNKRYHLGCVGRKFLTDYFLFQFNRVEDLVFNRFSSQKNGSVVKGGKIQIIDIIGKKAFEYWLKRDIEFDYLFSFYPIINKYKISLGEINTLCLTPSTDKEKLSKAEEIEKGRFHNKSRGILNCIEKTSLFNHHSQFCLFCDHKTTCKELLKLNFKDIYNHRGYATNP